MYIPEFWAGVLCTVAFEFLMIIGAAVLRKIKKDNE